MPTTVLFSSLEGGLDGLPLRPARTVGGRALFEHRRSIGHPPVSSQSTPSVRLKKFLAMRHTLPRCGTANASAPGLPVGGGIANSMGYSA